MDLQSFITMAEVIGAVAAVSGAAYAIWKRFIFRAKLEIKTIDPVYWDSSGCPIEIRVAVSSGDPRKYKVVVFQKNTKEDYNRWHFQFENLIVASTQSIKGFVWYGGQEAGDLDFHEVLAGVIPITQTPRRHPGVNRIDDYSLRSVVVETVQRNDKRARPVGESARLTRRFRPIAGATAELGVRRTPESTMLSGVIVGYDSGGNDAHGVAELRVENGRVVAAPTQTLETAEQVIALLDHLPNLIALGLDSLTCWSTGSGGWRPADRWLRQQYKEVQNSVMTPNGLAGSMGLNGMAVLIAARSKRSDLLVTETHPKVLYWHLERRKYDYGNRKAEMDSTLTRLLGTSVAPANEHEWDAGLSAFAALEGAAGRWRRDLHSLPLGTRERLITPCGKTQYFWPE